MAERRRPAGRPSSAQPPPGRAAAVASAPKPVSAARAAAFELLLRIGESAAHSDDLLHGPRVAALSQVDRDLTTALVLGVLRWQIALDARIRPLLSRPDATVPEPVAIALRLGAFQLLHMDRIPAHAALHESVELVREAGQPQAAGMVNAVLRRLVGAPAARRPLVETPAGLAERLGHPAWMVERWIRQFGRGAAERICEFDQAEPERTAVFATTEQDAVLPVIDAGSRLVAELAAAAVPDAGRVWDCCAAPGGKLLVLAHRLPRAELLATDSSPKRLQRLTERLQRSVPGRAVRTAVVDAAEPGSEAGQFDLILCDVPCSGTGTLARNPEIRHRLRNEDLVRQQQRQSRILRAALGRLAPGGRLLYSTCSLEPEECEAVVGDALLGGEGRWMQLPVSPLLADLRAAGRLLDPGTESLWVDGVNLRTVPGMNLKADGFFAALFQAAE